MNNFIDKMEARLTEEDKMFLKKIYAPKIVAVPPDNAFNSLTVMPDGEIRCYGTEDQTGPHNDDGVKIYLSSTDCGLSWKKHLQKEGSLGRAAKSPYSNRYITPKTIPCSDADCVSMLVSEIGPDDTNAKEVPFGITLGRRHLPIALRGKKRWIFAGDYNNHTATVVSDDDGDSWKIVEIEETDHFEICEPHKGKRWENSGKEAAITELSDGTLMMMLRTSTDYHYVCYSYDFGDSWTKPKPSTFHSTLTEPELLRLKDGRILFFYNNTRPLPEVDLENYWPTLTNDEKKGVWEDVFTNRDSNCIAISEDDGKTWKGFRELHLNQLRNTCDFRSSGGNIVSTDKSVHQYQAIELPYNKILVHVGQHPELRKILIFDIDWLYETEKGDDFKAGIGGLSTQVYLKSVSGGYKGPNFTGHCAWNRTNGAVLVPDPSGDSSEALLIRNTDDDRLFSNAQGAVWNFPAAHKGKIGISLKVMGEGLRISVLDHWMNPIDLTVPMYAQFSEIIKPTDMRSDKYTELTVLFDTDNGVMDIYANNEKLYTVNMENTAPNGVCYLHMQTVSDIGDNVGTLIKKLSYKAE